MGIDREKKIMSKSLFTDASSRLERALKYVSISDDAIEYRFIF